MCIEHIRILYSKFKYNSMYFTFPMIVHNKYIMNLEKRIIRCMCYLWGIGKIPDIDDHASSSHSKTLSYTCIYNL